MSEYKRGLVITNKTDGNPTIQTLSSSVIGLVGTGDFKDEPATINKVSLAEGIDAFVINNEFEIKNLTDGTLKTSLNAVFAQVRAKVVCVSVEDEAKFSDAIKLLSGSQSKLGLKPAIILCPDPVSKTSAEVGPNPKGHFESVVDALKSTAKKLKAISIVDLGEEVPEYTKESYKDLDSYLSERLIVAAPYVENEPGEKEALSPWLAGRIVRTDAEHGFHHSPSNRRIENLRGLSAPVSDEDANTLNSKKITTVIFDGGATYWGNSGNYDEGKDRFYKFISVVRTEDALHRTLKESLKWAIDRGITKNFINSVVAKVDTWLAELKRKEIIIDGECFPNEEENTKENIVKGHLTFVFKFTPIFIAEAIEFQSQITDEYITQLRG